MKYIEGEDHMVTLSICMIVKDEEQVLQRCLESVKELADEIIIVDTGSKDQTKFIAKQYTKKVLDFAWIDDFAAARNYAFEQAEMDYLMWLDADDVVPEKTAELILKWKRECDFSPDILMLKYAVGFDKDGKITFSYYRERILKRERHYRFQGRVHEAIPLSGKITYLNGVIEHRSIKKEYSTRNLDIYERMKAEGKLQNPRDVFYYARELYYHGKDEAAVENVESFLQMQGCFVENQVDACRFAAYAKYRLGEEQKALEYLLRGLSYQVPGGELCCDLGKHFYDRMEWSQAIFWYENAARQKPNERSGRFINWECYGYLPCLQLSVCYFKLGEWEKALRYHERAGVYRPNAEEYLQNEKFFRSMRKEDGSWR